MDINQLLYFKAIAETENISKAAKNIHVSQPALSQSLASLEEELGIMLFDRERGRLKLNPTGKKILKYTDSIMRTIDKIKEEAAEASSAEDNRISIASVTKANIRYAGMLIADFNSETEVISKYISTEDVQNEISLEASDLIFSSEQYASDAYDCIKLCTERMFVSVPKNNHFFKLKKISLRQLDNEIIVLPPEYGLLVRTLLKYLKEQHIHPAIKRYDDDIMYSSAYYADNGYVFTTGNIAAKYKSTPKRKLVSIVNPEISFDIYLYYKKNLNKNQHEILSMLIEKYKSIK